MEIKNLLGHMYLTVNLTVKVCETYTYEVSRLLFQQYQSYFH